jgi:hypothetical protein
LNNNTYLKGESTQNPTERNRRPENSWCNSIYASSIYGGVSDMHKEEGRKEGRKEVSGGALMRQHTSNVRT